jgi:hypothetical protein
MISNPLPVNYKILFAFLVFFPNLKYLITATSGDSVFGSPLTTISPDRNGKPDIHLDLNAMDMEDSAIALQQFIVENSIEVLSAAGPRASKDGKIYDAVQKILTMFIEKKHNQSISFPVK